MLRKSILVLATTAVCSGALLTTAFAFGPPLPHGGPA